MRKNVASQNVAASMNTQALDTPLTASVTMLVNIDGGTQGAGGGTLTHEGNGVWNYVPTQAETNGNHLAFTFAHATGINQTVNVWTYSYDPHNTVDLGLTSITDLPTNTELATALGTADDAVLAAIAALNNLSQANVRTAVGLASANLDTQLDALPTTDELESTMGGVALATASIRTLLTTVLQNLSALARKK